MSDDTPRLENRCLCVREREGDSRGHTDDEVDQTRQNAGLGGGVEFRPSSSLTMLVWDICFFGGAIGCFLALSDSAGE